MPPADPRDPLRCLWCSAELSGSDRSESVVRCRRCGRGNRREDLRTYHTLNPAARRLQTGLEILALVGLGACFFACVVHWRHLKGGKAEIALPIVGATLGVIALFYGSRFLTRRPAPGRPGCLHPAALLTGAAAFAGYFFVLGLQTQDLEGSTLYVALGLAAIVVMEMARRIRRALAGRVAEPR